MFLDLRKQFEMQIGWAACFPSSLDEDGPMPKDIYHIYIYVGYIDFFRFPQVTDCPISRAHGKY